MTNVLKVHISKKNVENNVVDTSHSFNYISKNKFNSKLSFWTNDFYKNTDIVFSNHNSVYSDKKYHNINLDDFFNKMKLLINLYKKKYNVNKKYFIKFNEMVANNKKKFNYQ